MATAACARLAALDPGEPSHSDCAAAPCPDWLARSARLLAPGLRAAHADRLGAAQVASRLALKQFTAAVSHHRSGPLPAGTGSVVWAQVLALELVLLKGAICHNLDRCSAALAFWKDLELRPVRVRVVSLSLSAPSLRLSPLEALMAELMDLLGEAELVFHALADPGQPLAPSVRRACRILLTVPTLAGRTPGPDLGPRLLDLPSHLVAFQRRVQPALAEAVTWRLREDELAIPPFWRQRWPEVLMASACVCAAVHAFATGALRDWLQDASRARRSGARPAGQAHGSAPEPRLSWHSALHLAQAFKSRISLWVNKKVLTHITQPTRNLINELTNHKELVADIELFSKDDAAELEFGEQRLIQLAGAQKEHIVATGRRENRVAVRQAVASTTREFEQLAKRPVSAIFAMRSRSPAPMQLLRPIFINFYFLKVEMLYVLKAMDYLLKGTNFNFELLATAPAIACAWVACRWTIRTVGGRPARQRSAVAVLQRIRLLIRDLEVLLNRYCSDDVSHLGRFVLLHHQLEVTLHEHLWDELTAVERRQLQAILDQLEDPFSLHLSRDVCNLFEALH